LKHFGLNKELATELAKEGDKARKALRKRILKMHTPTIKDLIHTVR
jgi:hypothetical protein